MRRAHPVDSPSINRAKLEEVEDQLLAQVIAHHGNREHALDDLLDDVESLPKHVPARRSLLLRSSSDTGRIEDLLLEAVLRMHPHREHALGRMLAEVATDTPEPIDEERDRALFDTQIDNDFDGLA